MNSSDDFIDDDDEDGGRARGKGGMARGAPGEMPLSESEGSYEDDSDGSLEENLNHKFRQIETGHGPESEEEESEEEEGSEEGEDEAAAGPGGQGNRLGGDI